jgi:flagellar biogenesis protein FliO
MTDRIDKMSALHTGEQVIIKSSTTAKVKEARTFAGWLSNSLRELCGWQETSRKQLRLVETLSLGGKKQLMLVTYAGESFLVGGGVESVQTILRLNMGSPSHSRAEDLSEICE